MAYPACIINGAAVTKTFQILYRNEEVRLEDVMNFRIHTIVEAGKVNTSFCGQVPFFRYPEGITISLLTAPVTKAGKKCVLPNRLPSFFFADPRDFRETGASDNARIVVH